VTDEVYGRLWGEQNNCHPVKLWGKNPWSWYDPPSGGRGVIPPEPVWVMMPTRDQTSLTSESEAYAALGRAVRAVHQIVPEARVLINLPKGGSATSRPRHRR
jgi:hypothetical protein